MDVLNTRMSELLAHTKDWQEESRIAYIRPRIAAMYEEIHADNKAKADAEHEARFGHHARS